MARQTPKRKPTNQSKGVDLSRLSQTEAARLINRPASWIRDNTHIFDRNADGSYDGAKLVRAIQTDYQPADLSEIDAHHAMVLGEHAAAFIESMRPAAISLLEEIRIKHGMPGLAAFAEIMLSELKLYEQTISSKLSGQTEHDRAFDELRTVSQCNVCKQVRWAGEWQDKALPSGYVALPDVFGCPKCAKKIEAEDAKKVRSSRATL